MRAMHRFSSEKIPRNPARWRRAGAMRQFPTAQLDSSCTGILKIESPCTHTVLEYLCIRVLALNLELLNLVPL